MKGKDGSVGLQLTWQDQELHSPVQLVVVVSMRRASAVVNSMLSDFIRFVVNTKILIY